MFTYLRSRLGVPGLVAIAALVFAMVGGAVAANDGSEGPQASASAKKKAKKGKKGPRGPRGFKGATGAAGPAGPAGPASPAGAKGDAGSAGAQGAIGPTGPTGNDGDPGDSGESVVVTPIAAEGFDCEGRSGAFVEPEDEDPKVELCTGKEGSPWVAGGTLPVGSTLKGTYAFTGTTDDTEGALAAISFSIPRAGAPNLGATKVHWEEEANFLDFDEAGTETIGCGPSPNDPQAPSGHLCVYKGALVNATFNNILTSNTAAKGVSRTGAVVKFNLTGVGFGSGSWAFTG